MLMTEPKLTPPVLPSDSVNTGNNTLKLATEAEGAGDYTRAFILCNEAIEQGVSADWVDGQAFAYNMRGTYKWVLAVDLPSTNRHYVADPFFADFQVHGWRYARGQGRL